MNLSSVFLQLLLSQFLPFLPPPTFWQLLSWHSNLILIFHFSYFTFILQHFRQTENRISWFVHVSRSDSISFSQTSISFPCCDRFRSWFNQKDQISENPLKSLTFFFWFVWHLPNFHFPT
jgi:hypothetical protein